MPGVANLVMRRPEKSQPTTASSRPALPAATLTVRPIYQRDTTRRSSRVGAIQAFLRAPC